MGKRIKYNTTYYVIFTVAIGDDFVKSYIYNSNTQTHKIIKNQNTLTFLLEDLYTKTKSPELTRIYCNKTSARWINTFGNKENYPLFSITTYDDILPNYSSWLPLDYNDDYCIEKLYSLSEEISFYVNKIGLHYFKKANEDAGYGKIAALCLEKDYPDLVNANNVLDVIKRAPSSKYISILKNLKRYGANCIISNEGNGAMFHNVVKLDIDSSFSVVPILHKTMINLRFKKVDNYNVKDLCDLIVEGKKGFVVELKLNQQPSLKNYNYPDFLYKDSLDDVGMRLGIKKLPTTITLTHLGLKNLLEIYNLNPKLIEIKKLLVGDLVDYLPFQKELLTRLHKDKSYYKEIGNILEKNKTKKTMHCLHGRGIMNIYNNIKVYQAKWETKGKRFINPGDFIFNYIDSIMMYEYARDAILTIIRLCLYNKQHTHYYDTDCVVIPNNPLTDLIIKEYNHYMINQYKMKGYDIKDYTHYGHTIGLLEKEAVYDKFTYKQGKFYLYEIEGKLHSTTSGFPTDLIANKLEEVTGLNGMEAYLASTNISLDLGWIYNPTTKSLGPLIF